MSVRKKGTFIPFLIERNNHYEDDDHSGGYLGKGVKLNQNDKVRLDFRKRTENITIRKKKCLCVLP